MSGRTAICFVLANPPTERRIAAIRRRANTFLRNVPVIQDAIKPRWSPARRLGYGAGLRACVQSLRRRHRKLPPLLLLTPESGVTLADVDEVVRIDPLPYAAIPIGRTYWGREVYYKLAVFNLRGYDRIIYLDCDTIVLDDISPLWELERYSEKGLYGVRETDEMGVHPSVFGKLNTGVMVINRPLLSEAVHRRMIEIACTGISYDGGDQGVINHYLSHEPGASVGDLEARYNVLVCAKMCGQWELFKDSVKILHYTNRFKPWALNHHHDLLFDVEFKRLWDEAYAPIHKPARLGS